MGIGKSSESTIYVGKTTTEGTEPTTYDTITAVSHSVEPGAQSFQSESLDPTGKALDSFRHSVGGRGDLNTEWFPSIFDSLIEIALKGAFGSAFNQTLTISFSAPSASLQTLTDDGATGVLGGLTDGDVILIAGAVAAAENAGLRRVVSSTTDTVTVYNPSGSLSAADAGVDIDHAGVATLGTTAAWAWLERLDSDGTNLIHSEFYSDLVVESWNPQIAAARPIRNVFRFQGDAPTIVRANGSPPITKQRGGSDNAATTARIVHGMEDVREIILYSPTEGIVILTNLHNNLGFTVGRQIVQDVAVGTSSIINTNVSRPTIQGQLNAFLNDVANGTGEIQQFFLDNPDDMTMHVIFGATDATAYGVWFDTVRFQSVPKPVSGNNQSLLINSTFSATDMKVTRI